MVGHQHLTRGHVVDLREGDHCVHTAARHPGASPPPADKWIKKRHFLSVIYLSLNGLTIHCMRRDWLLILSLMLGTPSTFILPYSAPPSHNNRIKMYAMFLPCTHIHSIVSIRGFPRVCYLLERPAGHSLHRPLQRCLGCALCLRLTLPA